MKRAPRRKVANVSTVFGYRGYPNTVVTLECGHEMWFPGDYSHQHKEKSRGCWPCVTTCVACGKLGAVWGGRRLSTDPPDKMVSLCPKCSESRNNMPDDETDNT